MLPGGEGPWPISEFITEPYVFWKEQFVSEKIKENSLNHILKFPKPTEESSRSKYDLITLRHKH